MLPTNNNRRSGSRQVEEADTGAHSAQISEENLSIAVNPVAELMGEANIPIYQDPTNHVSLVDHEEGVSVRGHGRTAPNAQSAGEIGIGGALGEAFGRMGMDTYRFTISEDENSEITAAIRLLDFLAMRNTEEKTQFIESLYEKSIPHLRSLKRGLDFIDTLHTEGAITHISTLIVQQPTMIIAEVSHLYHNSEQENNLDVQIAIALLDLILEIKNEQRTIDGPINRDPVWSVNERDVVHVESFQMPPGGVPQIEIDEELLGAHEPITTGFSKEEKESILVVKIMGGPVEFEGQKTCSVCIDDFDVKERARQLDCKHRFHQKCLWTWLDFSRLCPNCRHPITVYPSQYHLN